MPQFTTDPHVPIKIGVTGKASVLAGTFSSGDTDVISGLTSAPVIYLPLSFGPGQRYASKGCYIVQPTVGPDPKLLKKAIGSNIYIY